jgi:hypothetical protein
MGFAGAFLTGALRHWKRLHIWVAWWIVLFVCASTDLFLFFRDEITDWLCNEDLHLTTRAFVLDAWRENLIGAACIYTGSFVGIPLGWAYTRFVHRSRTGRWKRRIRKMRRKRRSE